MSVKRPIVLSIAGFDPSAGAGLLADIKTFEQHNVYGLAVSTSQTLQTEDKFFSIRWEKLSDVLKATQTMLREYDVKIVKIGIVENLSALSKIVSLIQKTNSKVKIVVDPIIKSSTNFDFWQGGIDSSVLQSLLKNIYLLTPNVLEAVSLAEAQSRGEKNAHDSAEYLSQFCNVLLKGGHSKEKGVDILFTKSDSVKIKVGKSSVSPKHGSGCILSAAITANLALGNDLEKSCRLAKKYTEQILSSNNTNLAYPA